VPDYHTICKKRFKSEQKIHVHPFGLSSENGRFPIAVADNGSSISSRKDSAFLIEVPVESIKDFIGKNGINKIDLLKINIEGGEYDVLPALISTGLINIVDEIQIQFHDFIPEAEKKRDEIRSKLSLTHNETWCYRFVWENWKRKA
jgi:FkbM family methyltransferase